MSLDLGVGDGPAPRVIHTGQALVDVVLEVPGLPRRGGNVVAQGCARHAGGAVTILLAAARSGARCVHAGAHGTGPHGDTVRSALADDGVELASPPVLDQDTGSCLVLLEPGGERTFVTTHEAEREISVASLDAAHPRPGDLVCVSGYSLHGRTREPLLAWLAGLPEGVVVVLDPGDALEGLPAELVTQVLARTSVWTSNLDEASALTGASGMADAADAVRALLPAGAAAIVRDGPAGCAVSVCDAGATVLAGFPERAVDTNGAGDTHTGVLVAERARGTGWVEACRRANAAAAVKVTRRGPTTAPGHAEIDAYLARQVSG